jgi:hypothetical protein
LFHVVVVVGIKHKNMIQSATGPSKIIEVGMLSVLVPVADVKFQVLAGTSMKATVFWDVVPCSLVEMINVSEVHTASIIIFYQTTGITSQMKVIFPCFLIYLSERKTGI